LTPNAGPQKKKSRTPTNFRKKKNLGWEVRSPEYPERFRWSAPRLGPKGWSRGRQNEKGSPPRQAGGVNTKLSVRENGELGEIKGEGEWAVAHVGTLGITKGFQMKFRTTLVSGETPEKKKKKKQQKGGGGGI